MQIRTFSPPPNPQPPRPPVSGGKVFHEVTDTLAGAVTGAVLGATAAHYLQARGAPVALVTAAAGGLAGALWSNHGGAAFHRSTAIVSGSALGAVAGALTLASFASTGPCNPDILIYGLFGALGGAAAGGVAGGMAAGHFQQ